MQHTSRMPKRRPATKQQTAINQRTNVSAKKNHGIIIITNEETVTKVAINVQSKQKRMWLPIKLFSFTIDISRTMGNKH